MKFIILIHGDERVEARRSGAEPLPGPGPMARGSPRRRQALSPLSISSRMAERPASKADRSRSACSWT